jgi:hypothetical protein
MDAITTRIAATGHQPRHRLHQLQARQLRIHPRRVLRAHRLAQGQPHHRDRPLPAGDGARYRLGVLLRLDLLRRHLRHDQPLRHGRPVRRLYDEGYKAKGLDHLETFSAETVKEAFETISRNWINEGYDPLSAPLETGSPLGPKTEERTDELVRGFAAASRMLGLEGEPPVRSDATGHPINRAFADLEFDKPEIACEPASRASSTRSTCSTTSPRPT